ncbi:hypothetical protein ACFE04_004593 [Oxalis oulophora]
MGLIILSLMSPNMNITKVYTLTDVEIDKIWNESDLCWDIVGFDGSLGGIIVIWKGEFFKLECKEFTDQAIYLSGTLLNSGRQVSMIFVYASVHLEANSMGRCACLSSL